MENFIFCAVYSERKNPSSYDLIRQKRYFWAANHDLKFFSNVLLAKRETFLLKYVNWGVAQGRRERGAGGGCQPPIRLEFIYWTRHKWQKVDSFSEFVILAVNRAITVTNNEFVRLCF